MIPNVFYYWLNIDDDVTALKLGEHCVYDQSCQYFDRNSVCTSTAEGAANECRCRPAFHPSITLESISRTSICIPGESRQSSLIDSLNVLVLIFSICAMATSSGAEPHGPWLKSDVPTVIGLGVGMSIFMALTCLVLKLFSRARFAQDQARGYGNAHLAPPTGPSANSTHAGKNPMKLLRVLVNYSYQIDDIQFDWR